MKMSWIALTLAAGCIGSLGAGCISDPSRPPPNCSTPDGGRQCSCPGTSVQLINPPAGCPPFTCLEDGQWAPYDAACLAACAEPQPQCSSCPGSPPIVPNCQQGQWVCPPAGPCASPPIDASTSDSPGDG